MPNIINYVDKFLPRIQEIYRKESLSDFLTTPESVIKFLDAKTIKVPQLKLGGYGSHSRSVGFNTADASLTFQAYTLAWDRDVEFFLDNQDVDETNKIASTANIHNRFERDVAIPERDKYRFSKIYQDAVKLDAKNTNKIIDDTTKLTEANILATFDSMMEKMDEAEVTSEGRHLVVTPAVNKMLKNAQGIQRVLDATKPNAANRIIHSLDEVTIHVVPSVRLKTKYADSGTGINKQYAPTSDALQIHMMLIEPSAVIATDKYSYIHMFEPGQDSRTADGYIYQNRKYGDLFLIADKAAGVSIVADKASSETK